MFREQSGRHFNQKHCPKAIQVFSSKHDFCAFKNIGLFYDYVEIDEFHQNTSNSSFI